MRVDSAVPLVSHACAVESDSDWRHSQGWLLRHSESLKQVSYKHQAWQAIGALALDEAIPHFANLGQSMGHGVGQVEKRA